MKPSSRGMAEPPEGAIVGESVPRENETEDRRREMVDRVVGELKGHPAFRGRSDSELRELARERVERLMED